MASIPNKKCADAPYWRRHCLSSSALGWSFTSCTGCSWWRENPYKQEAMSRQLRATTINANRGPFTPPMDRY